VLDSVENPLSFLYSVGHFTQLVWKSSREVGIGRAQSRDGKWFVVANFFPAGNYVGRNAENVLPPSGGKITIPVANTGSPSQGNFSRTPYMFWNKTAATRPIPFSVNGPDF